MYTMSGTLCEFVDVAHCFNSFFFLQGLRKLQTEISVFEKQKTEELERLEQFREEELRKLRYVLILL